MKIRAPDNEVSADDQKNKGEDALTEDVEKSFLQEIKQLLQTPDISLEIAAEGVDSNSPTFRLDVLKNFTALCREEIIPRHKLVAETIQSKSDELHYNMILQNKEIALLMEAKNELEESRIRLEDAKAHAQTKHNELNERLKKTLYILKNQCNSKTVAEKKMAEDLVTFKKRAGDLKVCVTSLTAKANYYSTQVNAQTESLRKNSKPLYLDKNRAAFLRSNLNSMRENIEQMVRRVKAINKRLYELEPVNQSTILND